MKKKKLIILIAINSIMLLLLAIVLIRSNNLKGVLQSQLAAERFAGQSEERFAQISAFYPKGTGINFAQINSFKDTLESKMTEASLEVPEEGSLWIDTWSMKSMLQVRGLRGNANATVYGVGGNFFFFHPLRLRSGSYISDSDFSNDRVVLNEELAWQLFGSYNVTGMQVEINGIPYIVAGVVGREKDFASTRANTDGACIYMNYEHLADRENALFDCYEIVLPEPVTGFAKKTVTEGLGGEAEILQNTGRYGIGKQWRLVKDFGERAIQDSGIAYPYWENAARLIEDNLALLFVLALLLSIFPLICLIVILTRVYSYLKSRRKAAFEKIDRKREQIMIKLRSKRKSKNANI